MAEMRHFDHATTDLPTQAGLIALQSDETVERDLRALLPATVELLVTRVPSAPEVTPETLAAMKGALTGAAALFPLSARLAAVGYGCTSATATIGAAEVAAQIRAGCTAAQVTDPLTALLAALGALEARRIALLTPYIAPVSQTLTDSLARAGIAVTAFGSFEIAEEARVARIAPASIADAALALAQGSDAQAVFLSCTNLRTLDVIAPLEAALGLPVLSSNLVLGWHMARLAGARIAAPARLAAL